jgi:hypothetical protein
MYVYIYIAIATAVMMSLQIIYVYKYTYHKVPLNICPHQAGNKWHPNEGIACKDGLLDVFLLTIGKVTSLAHKWLTATIVDIDESHPWNDSFQGKTHQLTISGEMVPGNKLTPPFTSQASHSWFVLHLNLVRPPPILEVHTIPYELCPCVAWDNFCTKSTHLINTILLTHAMQTMESKYI